VAKGDPQNAKAQSTLVPVSPEDFARSRRKTIGIVLLSAALLAIGGFWGYLRYTRPIDAQKSYDAGARQLRVANYTQAILSFDRAIALKPDFTKAYVLRGRANAGQNEPEPAVADFSKAIELSPGDSDLYLDRAAAYLELKNYKSVVEDCTAALARKPNTAQAFNLRGVALRNLGELPKALEDFNRAVQLAPTMDNYFQRASTHQLMGEHRLAIADLDQVISFDRTSPQAYFARAESLRALGENAAADRDHHIGRILDGR